VEDFHPSSLLFQSFYVVEELSLGYSGHIRPIAFGFIAYGFYLCLYGLKIHYFSHFPALEAGKQDFPESAIDREKLTIFLLLNVSPKMSLDESGTVIDELQTNVLSPFGSYPHFFAILMIPDGEES
jgi:hypothetical protein